MRSADGTNLICQAPSLRAPSCEPYFRKVASTGFDASCAPTRPGPRSLWNHSGIKTGFAQFCHSSARDCETAVRARQLDEAVFASTYRSHQRTARNAAQNSQQPQDRQQASSTPSARATAQAAAALAARHRRVKDNEKCPSRSPASAPPSSRRT